MYTDAKCALILFEVYKLELQQKFLLMPFLRPSDDFSVAKTQTKGENNFQKT